MTHMRDRLLLGRIARTKKSVLLLGPRQVGKSTLVRALGPALVVNLADETEFLAYAKDPGLLSRRVAGLRKPGLVVIDEVQRVPRLLNAVQALLDAGRPAHRFILTGSSARSLKRRGANLLPGRVVLEYLDPLSALELGTDLHLGRALQVGMLPGIYLDPEEGARVLGTYADVYLREEIRAQAEVRDIGSYARFLDVAAMMSGQWLNYSKLASDTEIPKETIRRYVSLLEDTLLVFRLPAFVPRRTISRRVSQRDKLLFFDVGVRNALLGLHRQRLAATEVGAVFEQWLILQVIYLNRIFEKGWRLSSYRTAGGAEVDLVVERQRDVVGIEIKAGRTVSARDARGLQSLAETLGRYKPLRRWIAYRGEHPQVFGDGAEVLPYGQVLERLGSEAG
jgi:predicted AAA+ superfamily ATPase